MDKHRPFCGVSLGLRLIRSAVQPSSLSEENCTLDVKDGITATRNDLPCNRPGSGRKTALSTRWLTSGYCRPNAPRMNADVRLDAVAAHQYGVFTRDQALRAGVGDSAIETRVKNGSWVRLAPATYAMRSAPSKWERQLAAAVLSHPGAIVGGGSAAVLHDLPGFAKGRPTIVVPEGVQCSITDRSHHQVTPVR